MILFLKFYILPIILFALSALLFRIHQFIGIVASIYFGYWFLDTLIIESDSFWFKFFAITLVLIVNGSANSIGEKGDSMFAQVSGFFATGFLIALLKYWFF